MIKVKISSDEIIMRGHACYDEYGKDIVCAAASCILTTTVNAILSFDEEAISYTQEDDEFKIIINNHDTITDKLIDNMINLLKELESDYPKNINIK